jgi:glycerol-3-phosphate dehydrogenase (NAD(P)+)
MGIDMPITREVFRVLYEDKDPRAAVTDLMLREPTHERRG